MLSLDKFHFIKTYFGVAIFGTVSEMLVISLSGAWVYKTNDIFGVPFWAFMMWGIAGVCFVTLSSFFNEVEVK